MAVYVIGDIHGAYKALVQLIERIQPKKEEDRLIFLGDYVDGWSESAEVIAYLMQLDRDYSCTFIKGNHDAWCEQWLHGALPDSYWQMNGGVATVTSYEKVAAEEWPIHLAFFNRMQHYFVDEQNRLFIHAGFASMHGPEKEHYSTNYYWDRTLWEMALVMDKRIQTHSNLYPKRLKIFHEIYIGHTPTLNYDVEEPMNACNVWNIDTGAAYYGKLSAMDIDTKQVWQSDPVPTLYPNENGRNKY
ncbi:serine/threonine protein phosphatase 1 [Filimonas lacunae]|uniref:Serine/threonine protein phosphatase 1 n=1 Tax=Filimonas lacunae TaxID=477680 RepID=A0A173MMH3_9BACT|nr:metallophosphoesterase family protein [Filimonas lacunae]BAV08660.1 serine/threonine protein phosphatase [Filimonas lacunae]SIS59471.1 serine/threonine protein phosphatase 1 [Filimonas lacunae]